MITSMQEVFFISMCLQGVSYGLYSGIFVIYLQCPPKESRTAIIVSYAIRLLYVLSTVTFVANWVALILSNEVATVQLHNKTLSLRPQVDSEPEPLLLRIHIARNAATGCCDFIAQCILIYRCWIVWGKSIRVVIIPSFLAITYLATSLVATIGSSVSAQFVQGPNWIIYKSQDWVIPANVTGYAASMAVNTLVTGLIVFKILKVFSEVKPISVERTLPGLSMGSTGGSSIKLQHIIFVIIESGMALFAIQLSRIVVGSLSQSLSPPNLYDFVILIDQMFNGIAPTLIYVRVAERLSFDDEESFKEAVESLRFNNPPSDSNSTHQRMRTLGSTSGNMPPQERSEDFCFNHTPSDPKFSNTLRRMGDNSMPPQEKEDVSILEIPTSLVNRVHLAIHSV